ncbi:MAG: hypothetical protein M0P29_09705 [Sphaerochaetaceae bacterium]|nr:hypothetical protein [Sphaerochaetaceae bacterium]
MSSDKVQQLGNDLACLAASIAEIAEELKAMYDFDHKNASDSEPPAEQLNPPELAEVRAFLADKSRAGHTEAVRTIILRHGSGKLSEVDPGEYAAILAEAGELK